jgi:hypothetical protein
MQARHASSAPKNTAGDGVVKIADWNTTWGQSTGTRGQPSLARSADLDAATLSGQINYAQLIIATVPDSKKLGDAKIVGFGEQWAVYANAGEIVTPLPVLTASYTVVNGESTHLR